MKSSPQARRLIRAYIKFYGNERAAAKHLHMTQGQLNGLKSGRLKDTNAIKCALKRADSRAARAWLRIDRDEPRTMINDQATLKAIKRIAEQQVAMLNVLIKNEA